MPRPSPPQATGAATAEAAPADPARGAAGENLSPRAESADPSADTGAPSPETIVGVLPGDLSLAELFPAEAAMGATPAGATTGDLAPLAQGGQIGADGRSSTNPGPLVAGLIVTLAILGFGGGFLWWRNRDINYWPA